MSLRAGGLTGLMNQPSAQVIDGSLKFDDDNKNYLTRTPGSAGNNKTFTFSTWTKGLGDGTFFCNGVVTTGDNGLYIMITSNSFYVGTWTDSWQWYLDTNRLFRDDGWYHLVASVDTTQSTESDRVKLYVNGVQETSFATANYPSLNYDTLVNNTAAHGIGRQGELDSGYIDKKLSQFYWIDGQQLGPEYFGFTDPLTGVWRPKKAKTDGPNVGTTWSSVSTISSGGAASGKPLTNGFDGSTGTAFEGDTSGATVTVPVSATIVKGGVKVFAAVTSGNPLVVLLKNGGTTVETINAGASGGQFYSSSTYSGPITSLVISRTGRAPEFNAIGINGIILKDDSTTNLDFGTNGFYLPFDGNSPIGQDKSGNGNDYRPVNFGGSVELDNPQVSGARPILNTTQGGSQAGVGVFGSKQNVGYAVTVYDDGGGNKYYIDGVKQATLTGLIRGATYTFDTSDSTVGSTHPFRFAASDGGSEYVDGVAAITGTATTITIPHNAPDTLYYYCTSHSGMGSSITGITTNASLADPYAWKCILAVPGVGGDYEDVSPSIACTSAKKSASAGGDPSSDGSSNFYGSSIDLDGNDKVTYTRENAGDFSGQNDFTIEAWFNTDTTSATDAALFSNWDSGNNRSILFGPNASGNGDFTFIFNTTGSGSWTTVANPDAIAGKWMHVAWVYDHSATRHYAYINGVLQGSATGTAYNNSTANFLLGINKGDASGYYNGKVQDLRYYHAVKYIASGTTAGELVYTLPSANPDVLPDSPSGVSGSSKLTKITEGAVSFEGTATSKLRVPDSTDFSFGTNDFCIEYFYYNNSLDGTYNILFDNIDSNRSGIQLSMFTSNHYSIEVGDGSNNWIWKTTGDFPATQQQWVHFALTRDGNTFRAFENGVLLGTQTSSTAVGNPRAAAIGGYSSDDSTNYGFNGYISNFRIVNGSSVYTSRFTPPTEPLTNVTNTKLLCCQSNTSATEGAVKPGTITEVDAEATNFNPFNTDINTVRGQETGYATLNPLRYDGYTTSDRVFTDGNLRMLGRGDGVSNFGVTTGKFYAEVFVERIKSGESGQGYIGVIAEPETYAERGWPTSKVAALRDSGGGGSNNFYGDGKGTTTTTWTEGDTISVAFDADAAKVWIAKNAYYINGGNPATGATPSFSGLTFKDYYFLVSDNKPSSNPTTDGNRYQINFGQKPFKYAPPDGFQPLNAANVRPETVIVRPDQYVGVTTYAGDGTSVVVSDYQFKPDLVWIKGYTDADRHGWYDSVRGVQKRLQPPHALDQDTQNGVMSFDERGFSVGNYSDSNGSGRGYVAWSWKAGGDKNDFNVDDVGYATAAAAGLTGGSYSLTGASVGTKQGFSIVQWTHSSGTAGTINHGLLEAPTFIIYKSSANDTRWTVGHNSLGWNTGLVLDVTDAKLADDPAYWNGTAPTSSVFSIGDTGQIGNGNALAYLWHDVPGLQKFGSYPGSGSNDGTFVECGFKPAILWVKSHDTDSQEWIVYDSERGPTNVINKYLEIQADTEGQTGREVDFLSNGFKFRNGSSGATDNGSRNYIYCAWAEAPTFNLYGASSNAR